MMMTDEIKALGEVGAPALVKSISRPNSSSGARPPSRDGGRPPSRDGARPLSRQSSSGGIEVLPSTGVENSLKNGFTVRSRPDSARSITPVKQVALPSIPRKSEKKEPASDYDYHNEQKVNLKMSKAGRQSHDARNPENQGKLIKPIEEMDLNDGDIPVGPGGTGDQFGPNDEDSNDDDGDEDETSSEEVEDDDDDEPVKAPTELIMEFLHFVMNEEFENAQKLCKLILVYEPDNKEANTFLPLIEEKLQLDEENSDNSDSDEDSGDDNDEDDDGESDNQEEDSDVSGSSSEESSSNEEDSEEDNDNAKEEGDENRELTKNN